jgi:hypothetical protein
MNSIWTEHWRTFDLLFNSGQAPHRQRLLQTFVCKIWQRVAIKRDILRKKLNFNGPKTKQSGNLQYYVLSWCYHHKQNRVHNMCFLFCDGFCEASVSINFGSVIVIQQLVWIPELEFFSKDRIWSISDEYWHSKQEDMVDCKLVMSQGH